MESQKQYLQKLKSLEKEVKTIAYVDLSNVIGWQTKLKWKFSAAHIIKQLAKIPNLSEVKVYYGTDKSNEIKEKKSKIFLTALRASGGIIKTKEVKWINKQIDKNYLIKKQTLDLFSSDVEVKIDEAIDLMKKSGVTICEPKCNFDVEMALDIIDDQDKVSAIVIFSGDSDFVTVLQKLKLKNKKIYLFGVRGTVAKELWNYIDFYIDFGQWYSGEKNYFATPSQIITAKKPPNKK
jgi:uncharacterized LabA/DUF88 family protein